MLRSGGTSLRIGYRSTFTNRLRGFAISVDVDVGSVEVFVDLDPNLRVRNTTSSAHEDASELANGGSTC